ncbi:arylamine N-acetyltransferase family protein [Bordetella petrii]|uniref:arylamine N-acetyltransferase family protein n=1 Tax=Bordetella petrii TaxID=94624 RepID=UPI001A9658EC|nr:arylamine N-acetyltransferase [Bordetella petrii]MBO1112401.1 arylamine N-acetyltransferase [Bordetella petrii]
MSDFLDLPAYFARIGLPGAPAAPARDALQALVLHHTQAIPFENLNPFAGLPVSLELADVQRKLVRGQRGGYCYEHNLLFGAVLRSLGLPVDDLSARVLWNRPDDAITPRSHMLLAVRLDDEPCIVDVGFGGSTPTGVLRLQAGVAQNTPHGLFRLLRDADTWRLQSSMQGEWRSLYRFDLQPAYRVDYEVSNYYLSTHPDSHFVTRLVAARPTPRGRLALINRDYTEYGLDGSATRRQLVGTAEIRAVLHDAFGLALPDTPALNRRLDALP